ncbi:hypothetical protein ACFC0M_00360 [Streptomyces sp. NPDC056149]|uniref:hypothetical protein n=1 Tax=unclassified Streptomyces TaxID=2593676 RepID=UPI00238149C2|nr:hypothetical protein [Streptomyces sp. WZ-12]
METSSPIRGCLNLKAREGISTKTTKASLENGTISDHPFDRYRTTIGFGAHTSNGSVHAGLQANDVRRRSQQAKP